MPAAFSTSLRSGTADLDEDATPIAALKKRRGEKRDSRPTPAKKLREDAGDRDAGKEAGKAESGGATGSSTPPLRSTVSRADLATRGEPEADATEPKGKAKAKAGRRKKSEQDVAGDPAALAVTEVKKGKKAKPEGPYTKFKEEGSIPEPAIVRKELPTGAKSFKAVSWNLGGLRGFLKSRPEALPELARLEKPDVLGILETKLQEGAKETEAAIEALLESLPDYESAAVHCSTAKKGYSGTLVLLRKDGPKPLSVQPLDLPSAKDEGRLIIMEFEAIYLVLAYVPNSGEGLKRLDERIGQWDVQLREKMEELASKKPAVLIGDLNVAHRDVDIWNVEAPHIPKSPGTTNKERESFSSLLGAGFVDGFTQMHPEALGAFTYWSIRAGNRPKNRGLRLDYAVASRSLLSELEKVGEGPTLVDVFHLPEMSKGDHCPVGVLLSL